MDYNPTQYTVQVGGTNGQIVSITNGTTGQFLGANTGANPSWQTVSAPSGSMQAMISGYTLSASINQNTTRFLNLESLGVPATTTQAAASCVVVQAGTIKNLYIITQQAPSAGQTYTFNIAKNGTAQAMAAVIADTNKTGNETGNSFTVVAGDRLELYVTLSATATTLDQMVWSVGHYVT